MVAGPRRGETIVAVECNFLIPFSLYTDHLNVVNTVSSRENYKLSGIYS